MDVKFKEPAQIKTVIKTNPMLISYEIICAAERIEPKKAYLELLDQPAIIILYTPKEDTAKKYKIPKLKLTITLPIPKGITAQPNKLIKKVNIGEPIKIKELLLLGIIFSFKINLNPSANDCNKPKIPITFGPLRL